MGYDWSAGIQPSRWFQREHPSPVAIRPARRSGRATPDARTLRATPLAVCTTALPWSMGAPRRREFVVGRYIVDLCAPSRKLVVEVDGGYHARIAARDARRDRALARAGWRVLRLDAALLVADVEAAVRLVRQALETP